MCPAEVGTDAKLVKAREVEDVVVDTGVRFLSPDATCAPEVAFWGDDDTAGSFNAGAVTAGCFFLAAGVVLRGIRISVEKSDQRRK